jgi:hypothetical protein
MASVRPVRGAVCTALLAALALPAVAATQAAPYTLRVSPGTVQVEPTMQAPAWLLRVMGPDGKVGEDTLLDGEPLLIQPKLLGYPRFADGLYTFELTPVLGDRQRGNTAAANAPKLAPSVDVRSSGTFRVAGGRLYIAGATEPDTDGGKAAAPRAPGLVRPADVVNADDVIVQGSLCVGLDCVNNESFGFDTIRLRENNLRIKFDDTSTSTGFPNNDWQLTANDSASGGASKFSIEDITGSKVPFTVAAGAPTNTLFLSSAGNIGIGTNTPVLDVHVTTTDTPAWRFEQTSGGGFTAQTWDIGANEANFFVRDVTGGSRLPLRIRPGAPTSSVDIEATGDVGIGTASPDAPLHVNRAVDTAAMLRLSRGDGTPSEVSWDVSNDTEGHFVITDDPTNSRWPFWIARNAANDLLRVGFLHPEMVDINGNVRITGKLQMYGPVGPDYVFASDYALPTIAEHAQQMKARRHLPKVGAAQVDEQGQGVVDLYQVSHGMLEELEVAHLYIAELDGTVQALRGELTARDAELDKLRAEVEAIRQSLAK